MIVTVLSRFVASLVGEKLCKKGIDTFINQLNVVEKQSLITIVSKLIYVVGGLEATPKCIVHSIIGFHTGNLEQSIKRIKELLIYITWSASNDEYFPEIKMDGEYQIVSEAYEEQTMIETAVVINDHFEESLSPSALIFLFTLFSAVKPEPKSTLESEPVGDWVLV